MLNENGYRRKTYDEILTEIEDKARELFGENVRLGSKSVIGIILMIMAWFLSLIWQDNEDVYYSGYVGTANEKNLDRLMPLGGIRRNLARYSTGSIRIQGTPNYEVPAGFQVATIMDVFFETINSVILDSEGFGVVDIQAQETGRSGNVAAGAISIIVNPDANIEMVANLAETTGGREKETDQELRERFGVSVEGLGAATLPSIRSNLLKLDGVRAASVVDNYESEPDAEGRPPHSFQAYVLGGNGQEIAQTIFQTKAGGIQPYGDIIFTVDDDAGYPHKVGFSRAEEILIHIRIEVTANSSFPADGEELIRQTLIRFIGGEDSGGALYAGLNMGEDVIYSRLISQIYRVSGIEDVSISLSGDGSTFTESNIAIERQQVAQTNSSHIEVLLNV